jgi:hypothetical protein
VLFVPLAAFGDAGDFLPTIYSYSGNFELHTMHRRDENTVGSRGTKSSDLFATEQLGLRLDGYVYHPRFIQFLMRGAAGLSQERLDDQLGTTTETGLVGDYEFRTRILPDHPYHLELYTMRTTPVTPRQTAETRPTISEKGAMFGYTKRPIFFHLGYSAGDTSARSSSSEFKSTKANGSFAIGPINNTAAYSHTDTSTSMGTHSASDNVSLGNIVRLKNASLDSRLGRNSLKQDSLLSPSLDTNALYWTEQFNAELPWNFFTSASYDLRRYQMITEKTVLTPKTKALNTTKKSSFSLAHKLYDSVRTAYILNKTLTESSTGDSESLTNTVNGVYTKRIPDGRITIGVQGSRMNVNQENAPLVVGETYYAPVFGTFTIMRGNIDPASISIKVMSDSAGMLIDLVQNSDYIMIPAGNAMEITIVFLPTIVTSGHLPGSLYSFFVTYSVLGSTSEFELDTGGYSIGLSLMDNLINPYYNHSQTMQRILTGSVPGGPQESKTEVVGVSVQKAPYVLAMESRTVESDTSPSRSLRNSAELAQAISETVKLSAKAEHMRTIYGQGTLGTRGYTDRLTSVNVLIEKNVPRKNLTTSISTFYSNRLATIETDQYAIAGIVTWRVGEMYFNMGASINRAEAKGTGVKQTSMSEYYYLNMTRKLF